MVLAGRIRDYDRLQVIFFLEVVYLYTSELSVLSDSFTSAPLADENNDSKEKEQGHQECCETHPKTQLSCVRQDLREDDANKDREQ